MTYKEMAKEFECLFHVGKYGFRFFKRNINGGYHIIQVWRLDGTILRGEDMTRAIMLDDDLGFDHDKKV